MGKITIGEIYLTGLALKEKTINAHGQSGIDCKNLWHEFDNGNYASAITDKLSDDIYGVYYDYEGDSTQPFSYFIGCRIKKGAAVPTGLTSLAIPAGTYEKITATGKMPDCVIKTWRDIWSANYERTYQTDFEVYDDRSKDWSKAEVDVYISVKD